MKKLRRLIVRGPAWHGHGVAERATMLLTTDTGARSAWAQGLGQQARRQRQKLRRREGLRRQHIILRLAEDGRMMMARQAEGEAARYRQESRAAAQYGMQYAAIGS